MLVKITNSCKMNCIHCMVDALPDGAHMDTITFKKALEFTSTYDHSLFFISGGEPTDHPQFLEFLCLAKEYYTKQKIFYILVASNGLFLNDKEYTKEILKFGVPFQITNDLRYYPQRIEKFEHKLLTYENVLRILTPIGRASNMKTARQSPLCFNFRSTCYSLQDFKKVISYLRSSGKMCTPSININGDIVAGEATSCFKIGNIDNTDVEIIDNVKNMRCGKCNLHKNLTGTPELLWNELENI